MERVYKSMMGYKEADEKHACTHIILSELEYDMLENEREDARNKALKIERYAKKQLSEMEQQAQKKLYDTQVELEEVKSKLSRQRELNENLLRISRERANAERGLKPKKEHDGYIVLISQQIDYSFKPGQNSKYLCWKTVIKTPYDASMPIGIVQPMIETDLKSKFGTLLGIQEYSDSLEEILNYMNYNTGLIEKNTIFNTRYKANYRVGYWEVEYLHTFSITVPASMRQRNRGKWNEKE